MPGQPHVCVLCWDGCPVLCLRYDIPMWQHIVQSTTATKQATSMHSRDMTSDDKMLLIPNKTIQSSFCLSMQDQYYRVATTKFVKIPIFHGIIV